MTDIIGAANRFDCYSFGGFNIGRWCYYVNSVREYK